MTQIPRNLRSPETPTSSTEGADGEEFDALLQGMLDLADAQGNVTAVEFIERTLQEMKKMGIEANDYRIGLVLKHGIGARESVYDRVSAMSIKDFNKAYPGDIGEMVRWYLEPMIAHE